MAGLHLRAGTRAGVPDHDSNLSLLSLLQRSVLSHPRRSASHRESVCHVPAPAQPESQREILVRFRIPHPQRHISADRQRRIRRHWCQSNPPWNLPASRCPRRQRFGIPALEVNALRRSPEPHQPLQRALLLQFWDWPRHRTGPHHDAARNPDHADGRPGVSVLRAAAGVPPPANCTRYRFSRYTLANTIATTTSTTGMNTLASGPTLPPVSDEFPLNAQSNRL